MKRKQRVIAGAGLAAGLVAGGGAGLLIGASSGSAGAAPVAAVTDPSTPPASTPGNTTPADPAKPAADREARIREQLQPLVDDGTITAAELDAIVAKLAAAPTAAPAPGRGFGGPGRPGGMRGILGVDVDTVATTLGISADDVRAALRDGTTLEALAESKGKSGQDVIDALVAATKSQLDARVADGSITQADADKKLAEATKRITDIVDNGIPAGFPGDGRGARRGGQGSRPDGTPSSAPSAGTPSSTPSTSTG